MTERRARIKRLSLWVAVAGLLLVIVVLIQFSASNERAAAELKLAIAKLPTGITAAEADRRLGAPDRIAQETGVLVDEATLLTATNEKAAAYGPSRDFEVHVWRRGGLNAAVVIDEEGRVAGRYAWK